MAGSSSASSMVWRPAVEDRMGKTAMPATSLNKVQVGAARKEEVSHAQARGGSDGLTGGKEFCIKVSRGQRRAAP